MSNYEVIVGNIGTVVETNNPIVARAAYGEYKRQSQSGYGRAANEPVVVLKDGEVDIEYNPPYSEEDL
jgi:hypothetical protein